MESKPRLRASSIDLVLRGKVEMLAALARGNDLERAALLAEGRANLAAEPLAFAMRIGTVLEQIALAALFAQMPSLIRKPQEPVAIDLPDGVITGTPDAIAHDALWSGTVIIDAKVSSRPLSQADVRRRYGWQMAAYIVGADHHVPLVACNQAIVVNLNRGFRSSHRSTPITAFEIKLADKDMAIAGFSEALRRVARGIDTDPWPQLDEAALPIVQHKLSLTRFLEEPWPTA